MPTLRLDHVIYGGRDLPALMERFHALTGVAARIGGRHPGRGTMNALASLGSEVYLELLALDPSQSPKAGDMGERISAMATPRLFAYMLKCGDLEAAQQVLLKHGISAELYAAARDMPDGRTLRWRLLVPHHDPVSNPFGDFVPKLIDWQDSVHPATTSVPGCSLDAFELGHPQAPQLRALLQALGAELTVERADSPYFRLRAQTPNGAVVLTG